MTLKKIKISGEPEEIEEKPLVNLEKLNQKIHKNPSWIEWRRQKLKKMKKIFSRKMKTCKNLENNTKIKRQNKTITKESRPKEEKQKFQSSRPKDRARAKSKQRKLSVL